LIKRKKSKKTAIEESVVTTNRWGCGCVFVLFLGMIIAMVVAAYFQVQN